MDLPDIKVEGYEYLFTEHLPHTAGDIDGLPSSPSRPPPHFSARRRRIGRRASRATSTRRRKEGQAVASAFRVLLSLLRYGTETTKQAVLEQMRDIELLRSLICLA